MGSVAYRMGDEDDASESPSLCSSAALDIGSSITESMLMIRNDVAVLSVSPTALSKTRGAAKVADSPVR